MVNIPDILYKYRSLQDTYTLTNIKDNLLCFSHPNKFNDPYDCNPLILDTEYRFAHQTKMYFHNGNSVLSSNCINGQFNISYDIQKVISQTLLNRYHICCFSSIANSILMWSHYADYHQGICLAFKPKEDIIFFNNCTKVVYKDSRANYSLGNKNQNVLITKYTDWQYESEYRIIRLQNELSNDKNYQLVGYNPKALVEIIFGVKTDEINIYKTLSLCQNTSYLRHITFSRMILDDSTKKYQLKKVKL